MKPCNELLAHHSVSEIEPLFEPETIEKWNNLFDNIFVKQSSKRRYVFADDLYKLNLLNEIFSAKLQSLIYQLIPDAVLYHCHAYEIASNESKPHIIGDNNISGWHRDNDCKHDFGKPYIQHISLFVYLTDVNEGNGYFEISNKKINVFPSFGNTSVCYKLFGSKGHCFLFDRKSFHRASPNTSNIPRRVLKISIQSKSHFNHKLNSDSFKFVRNQLNEDQLFLKQLFGDKSFKQELIDDFAKENFSFDKYNGELPANSYLENFSLMENYRRYIRDLRFSMRRTFIKVFRLKDNKTPIRKITS